MQSAQAPPGQRDGLLVVARGSVLARWHVQVDRAASRPEQQHELRQQGERPTPQRDERDTHRVDPRQALMGRQGGIEHQVRRRFSVRPLPEPSESEDVLRLVSPLPGFPRTTIDLTAGVEDRLLGFERHHESIAAPYDWRFTNDDLDALIGQHKTWVDALRPAARRNSLPNV